MSPLPGGPADKAGNSYEHWWTAFRIAEMLIGRVDRLRLEPPGDGGLGVEFEYDASGVTWTEQAKATTSTWTYRKLTSEGVLAAGKHQVDGGRRFRLVAASAATNLEALTERARSAEELAEFKAALTAPLTEEFGDLALKWAVDEAQAWTTLRGIYYEQWLPHTLRRLALVQYQALYSDDPEAVLAAVREFCDGHLHQSINAQHVRQYLKDRGFHDRLLAGDSDARRLLDKSVDRHAGRVRDAAPAFGHVPRPEATAIVEQLEKPLPGLVLLDAPAGYGKSAVVAQVAEMVEGLGWFVGIARLDLSVLLPTSRHLGEQMGLADSPSVVLSGVAAGSPGLMIVDQLDAISVFSGRLPDSFDAVREVLEELRASPNVKALLVVRTIDFERDPRLRRLINNADEGVRITLSKLDSEAVKAHLSAHGVPTPSAITIDLLCTPLHLAVFDRLDDDARETEYRTLQQLYEQLTTDVRRRATERSGGNLDWQGITSRLVGYMSDHESLAAPRALLDEFNVAEVAALTSEAVLFGDGDAVAFFHETFFDFLFARAFVAEGRDVHEFLVSTGQFLFRRAQARQLLEHLAATDDEHFIAAVVQLLSSDETRSHLKHLVGAVLRQTEGSTPRWAAIEPIAWSEAPIGRRLLAMLTEPSWFEAADALGRWEEWLADPDRRDFAAQMLTFAARNRGVRVADLMRPYAGVSEDWDRRIEALVSWSITPELVPFAVEMIEAGRVDNIERSGAGDLWSLLFELKDQHADEAARLIGAYLRRAQARSGGAGSDDPFESHHLSERSQSDGIIDEVAQRAPASFLAEVLPFVIAVSLAGQQTRDQDLWPSGRWWYRHLGPVYGVDDTLFAATESALCAAAQSDPQRVSELIAPLRTMAGDEAQFLACRALTFLPDADDAIAWVLRDRRNLSLGWTDSPFWATRELLVAHSGACSPDHFDDLEAMVIGYNSHHGPEVTRHAQHALLSGLDSERLSQGGRDLLRDLEAEIGRPPTPPNTAPMGGFIGSPISEDDSMQMSDDEWIAALREHATDATRWSIDGPVGGAPQLADQLGRRASDDPERFANLALMFDSTVPAVAMTHVVRTCAGKLSPDHVIDLCVHAAATYGAVVGRDVCSALERIAPVDGRGVELLELYAASSDPEPAPTAADTADEDDTSDPFSAGINSTRGGAALAIAATLFSGGDHLDELVPLVERLADDPSLAVRVCAAEAVVALLNHDSELALDIADRLFDGPIKTLDARSTERLLMYTQLRAPERFGRHLARALSGPPSVARRAGHIWAVADFRAATTVAVADVVEALPLEARLGAAETMAENLVDSTDALARLFDDDNVDIRSTAAHGLRNISILDPETLNQLVGRFLQSAAFDSHFDQLIDAFIDLGSELPPSALEVCERIVATVSSDLASMPRVVGSRIVTIALRVYRQAEAEARGRCLDLIDRLSDLHVFDIDSALDQER